MPIRNPKRLRTHNERIAGPAIVVFLVLSVSSVAVSREIGPVLVGLGVLFFAWPHLVRVLRAFFDARPRLFLAAATGVLTTATLVGLVASASPVHAQTAIVIELEGTMSRPAGTVELLQVEPVDPPLVGGVCTGVAQTGPNATVHVGNNVILETGGAWAVFFGVEDAPGVIVPMSEPVVLGETIDVYFEWGPSGITDLGITITLECFPSPVLSTTTAPTTTTTTTTGPPSTTSTTPAPPTTTEQTTTTSTTAPPATTTLPATGPPGTTSGPPVTTSQPPATTLPATSTTAATTSTTATLPPTSGSSTTLPPTPTTIGEVAPLAQALEAATTTGRFVFNPPSQMSINKTERIEVRITRAEEETVPSDSLVEGLKGGGEPAVESLKATELMRVQLSGDGFDIKALSEEEQIVDSPYTQWDFDVTPRKGGDRQLVLSIVAVVIIGEKDRTKNVPAIEKTVSVAVSTGDRVSLWWNASGRWFVGTLIAVAGAAAAWYGLYVDRRKKRDGTIAPVAMSSAGPVRVFVSYRRDDTAGWAGRIHDQLSARFGADKVFMDVEDIDPGVDFESAIHQRVLESVATVVLIGPRWLGITDEFGVRRLDKDGDYIVMEVRLALTEGKQVIPVLVQGAKMPSKQDLPESIRGLTDKNALTVSGQRFDYDMEQLALAIDRASADEPPGQPDEPAPGPA